MRQTKSGLLFKWLGIELTGRALALGPEFPPQDKKDLMWVGESWKTEYDIDNSLQNPPQDQLFPGNLTQQGKKHLECGFQRGHPYPLNMNLSCPFLLLMTIIGIDF